MSKVVGSYGYLRDFDWSMRMVLSSDKLSGLGKPILQLKLDTAVESNATTSGIQEHLVELDAKELDYLLNSLKAARAAVPSDSRR